MDTSLYHDDVGHDAVGHDAVKKLKRNMTLDFNNGAPSKKLKVANNLLSSPDLNMLKLASPELERMIILSQNGMVTTTPTPTQFLCPQNVTDEQEAYARGFVDALNELHGQEPPVTVQQFVSSSGNAVSHSMPAAITNVSMPATINVTAANSTMSTAVCSTNSMPPTMTSLPQSFTTTTSLPGGVMNTQQSQGMVEAPLNTNHLPNPMVMSLKEEPQTVPCLGLSPPLSPINMVDQEKIKLERKRLRNRVAARKCRTRKLERISRLEDRVDELKGQNSTLTTTATDLRDQVCKLKEQIMSHVNSGCHVMLSQNIL